MVTKEGGVHQFVCDGCGREIDTGQKTFRPAWLVASTENWERQCLRGNWVHYCPGCAERGNAELDNVGIHFFKRASGDD